MARVQPDEIEHNLIALGGGHDGLGAVFGDFMPGVQIVRVELHGLAIMTERFVGPLLFFPQVTKQIMHLGLLRSLLRKLGKDLFGDALRLFPFKSALAAKAMALDASE